MNEQPRPDLTDRDALEILEALALEFLNHEETRSHGEKLWTLFSYLEDRLSGENEGGRVAESENPTGSEIETVKEVMEKAKGQGVNVFIGCRIETVTVK